MITFFIMPIHSTESLRSVAGNAISCAGAAYSLFLSLLREGGETSTHND
jgi:hypothetical protein